MVRSIPKPEAFIGDVVIVKNGNRQIKIIKAHFDLEEHLWVYMTTDHGFSYSRKCLEDITDSEIKINLSKLSFTK